MRSLRAKVRIAGRLLRARLPETIGVRLLPEKSRYDPRDIPPPISAPEGATRLLIGPANFAGQGNAWARAAATLPGVSAMNMQYRGAGDYGFEADYSVTETVWSHSRRWGESQAAAVERGFTHVLIEAERSLFGRAEDKVITREVARLRRAGIGVGMVCHGTDIRLPSRHMQLDEFSPFLDADPDWVAALEARAAANQRILDRVGAPVFVSTPEMLLDRPGSQWLPVVVDPRRWQSAEPALRRSRPVVLHAPTNPLVKGTEKIAPVVAALHDEGLIDYRHVLKVPADEMPGLYATADVVLEQFALGMYSVTAVEAMAAGRLVIGHIHDQVRDHVREATGLELPVVSATPDSLESVLRDVVTRPEHYREIAARGPAFAAAVHDGAYSARVLAPFLGVKP